MRHRADLNYDDNGDPIDDRQKVGYRWYDPAYGPGVAAAIEITVRFNPDKQEPELVLYELTKSWLAVCRSVKGEAIKA